MRELVQSVDRGVDALHHTWTRAESIRSRMLLEVGTYGDPSFQPALIAAGQAMSRSLALEVYYGALYVVVEGYQGLGLQDAEIDHFLSNEGYVRLLRRFRNAVFHFTGTPLDKRLTEFLAAPESAKWAIGLNRAFRKFFEANIPVEKLVDWLAKAIDGSHVDA